MAVMGRSTANLKARIIYSIRGHVPNIPRWWWFIAKSCLFVTPWTIHGISRQEYWGGLLFPSPGDLRNPGIEQGSPALQADSSPTESPGKPCKYGILHEFMVPSK